MTLFDPPPIGSPIINEVFRISTASVPGREHLRLYRNNQDGLAVLGGERLLVAVVTDGCSSGRHSEVGARLGASWLARHLPAYHRARPASAARALAEIACAELVSFIGRVARDLSTTNVIDPAVIVDQLLFTFIAAVIDPARTVVFGVGDGVICLNDERLVLSAGPDNAPSYAAYRLLDKRASTEIHVDLPTADLETLLIGTDGAGALAPVGEETIDPLAELLADPRFLTNPTLVQRRLVALSQRRGPPHLLDDTTLVLVRRAEVAP